MTRFLCLLLLLAAACVAALAPAEAFSSFKGRFGGHAGNCVYPDRNGNEAVLQNGSSMPADPYNPALNEFNRSCSCPADDYETRLREPATLACSDGTLVTAMAARCECARRPGASGVKDVELIVDCARSAPACPAGYARESSGATASYYGCSHRNWSKRWRYSLCVKR